MDKDKSLTIDTSNYAAVLIYAKEIPFELSITHQLNIDKSAKKAPLASHFQKAPLASHFLGFAFMSSGLTNRHKIKKISSNSYTYKDILRMLMAIRYLAVDKIINIETIIDQNKEELDNVIVTNTNIIENNEKRWRAWYKKTDKKLYLYEEFIEKEITPTDPLYEEYLKQSSSLNVSENPNLNSPENINQNQINNLNEVIIKRLEKEYSTALDIFHTDKVPARKIQNQCQPSDTKTRARLLNIAVTKTHLDDSSMEDIVSDLVTNENIVNLNLFPLHPRCVLESAIAYGTTTTAELLVEKYYAQVLSDKNEILMKALDAGLGYNKIKFILKTLKTTPSNEVLKTAYSKSPHDVLYLFAEYVKFETEEVATDCLVKAIDNPNISLPSLEQICFYMQNIKPQVTQNLINNINPKNHALKEFLEKKLNIISE